MLAIATLVQNDPYLKLSPDQRLDARRERRSRLFGVNVPVGPSVTEIVSEAVDAPSVVSEADPSVTVDELTAWVERQKANFKTPWFSIVAEIDPPERAYLRIEKIQKTVAEHFGITRDDLICARRTRDFVLPRHIAMAFCREFTMKSYPEIGRRFGRRDHTVPLYACRKIDALVKTDPKIASDVEVIRSALVSQ